VHLRPHDLLTAVTPGVRTKTGLVLAIGGERLAIRGPALALRALGARYDGFVLDDTTAGDGPERISIAVHHVDDRFMTAWTIPEPAAVGFDSRGQIEIRSPGVHASLDPVRGEAVVDRARDVGGIDVVIRAALSTALPGHDALLMHGAVLDGPPVPVLVCGESGAGKSTVARAFGAACDELAVLRLDGAAVLLASTPYWAGRPSVARLDRVVCLRRDPNRPGVRLLRGSAGLRALARHVARYVNRPATDAAILSVLGAVCERVQVFDVACPEGSAFIPFLREALDGSAEW